MRGVTSNAIVLVRDGRLIGMGQARPRGSTPRAGRSTRHAPTPARTTSRRLRASDAFYPFPDAVEACLEAGVAAFVQPGGSMRDAEVTAAVDAAGAAMLVTGTRHFRH